MQFLIDGHRDRVTFRKAQWAEGVAGQLLTPLTSYRLGHKVFAIDNGAFTRLRKNAFARMVMRYAHLNPLFVAIPDKLGCHRTTAELYEEHKSIALDCVKAFVAQDGYTEHPACAGAIFIGGTDKFKDSMEALELVSQARKKGLHVHVGRVNGPDRFWRFHRAGAHTCDGSGVSRYDHMILAIKDRADA